MTKWLRERLLAAPDRVTHGLVLGGDFSQQHVGEYSVGCYAIVALRKESADALNQLADTVISRHVGGAARSVEIHAVDIWNRSSRLKTPFAKLEHKAAMQLFFAEFCSAVATLRPLIVVSVALWGGTLGRVSDMRNLKRTLVYAALSRLDANLKILSGKHLGEPPLIHDRENESIAFQSEASASVGGGIMDIRALPSSDVSSLAFYRAFDPVLSASDSRQHRTIQVADVAAYVVGKQLSLMGQLAESVPSPAKRAEMVRDCNFCRSLWDLSNLEAVLVAFADEQEKYPYWIRGVVDHYRGRFVAGVDMCICSIREAFDRSGRSPGLAAIDYVS